MAGLRIAYSSNLGFVHNDPEVDAAVRAAVDVLVGAGAEVDEVDPGFSDPVQAFHVLWFSGEAKVLAAYGALDDLADRIDPGLHRTAVIGARYSASDYLDAMAVRMELGGLMGRFHQTYDVLVTSTLPLPAFPAGQDVPDDSMFWSTTRQYPNAGPCRLWRLPRWKPSCGSTSSPPCA